jgi:hypothetical protein
MTRSHLAELLAQVNHDEKPPSAAERFMYDWENLHALLQDMMRDINYQAKNQVAPHFIIKAINTTLAGTPYENRVSFKFVTFYLEDKLIGNYPADPIDINADFMMRVIVTELDAENSSYCVNIGRQPEESQSR